MFMCVCVYYIQIYIFNSRNESDGEEDPEKKKFQNQLSGLLVMQYINDCND